MCVYLHTHTYRQSLKTRIPPVWFGVPSPHCLSRILSLAWHQLPLALGDIATSLFSAQSVGRTAALENLTAPFSCLEIEKAET